MTARNSLLIIAGAFIFITTTMPVHADKTGVTIEAPESVKKGQSAVIRITITHKGNNFMHHTNWVYVKADGKEIARWEFSPGKLPENEVFTRDVNLTVTGPVEITAEGNCNLHGGRGAVTKKIAVK